MAGHPFLCALNYSLSSLHPRPLSPSHYFEATGGALALWFSDGLSKTLAVHLLGLLGLFVGNYLQFEASIKEVLIKHSPHVEAVSYGRTPVITCALCPVETRICGGVDIHAAAVLHRANHSSSSTTGNSHRPRGPAGWHAGSSRLKAFFVNHCAVGPYRVAAAWAVMYITSSSFFLFLGAISFSLSMLQRGFVVLGHGLACGGPWLVTQQRQFCRQS